MAAANDDRRRNVLYQHELATAHVAAVGLQQEGLQIASGGQTDPVVEEPAVAAVHRVPGDVAGTLRLGELSVVGGEIAVLVDSGAKRDAIVDAAGAYAGLVGF